VEGFIFLHFTKEHRPVASVPHQGRVNLFIYLLMKMKRCVAWIISELIAHGEHVSKISCS